MNVQSINKIDDLLLNMELAKLMSDSKDEIHLVKGTLGYRVRVNTPNGWRIINFRDPKTVANLEKSLGIEVQEEEGGVFRAMIPGQRTSAKADHKSLAVVLAAMKVPAEASLFRQAIA